jgi:hypothetical protein
MLINCNVIDESDHKYISSNLSNIEFRIDFTSLDNSRASHSYNLGSEIDFNGSIQFFEHNKFVLSESYYLSQFFWNKLNH